MSNNKHMPFNRVVIFTMLLTSCARHQGLSLKKDGRFHPKAAANLSVQHLRGKTYQKFGFQRQWRIWIDGRIHGLPLPIKTTFAQCQASPF